MQRILITFFFCAPLFVVAGQGSEQCFDGLYKLMESSNIYKKIGLPNLKLANFEQMASLELVNDDDRPWISKYAQGSNICSELEVEEVPSNLDKGFREIIKENEDKKQSALIDLYNGKLSYGQYIQKRKVDSESTQRKMADLNDSITEHNARVAQQQKAENSRAWSDFWGSMGRAFAPAGSVNCSPNGTGGQTCYRN